MHAFDVPGVDELAAEVLINTLSRSPAEVASVRCALLDRWEARAAEPADAEAQLHEAMALDVRRVLQGKNLLVFLQILLEAQVLRAVELVRYMAAGFTVVGPMRQLVCFHARESRSQPV